MADEERKVKQVVPDGATQMKEDTGLKYLAKLIFSSDIKDIKKWLLEEQVLPWLKGTLINAIQKFTLNGKTGYSPNQTGSRTNYSTASTGSSVSTSNIARPKPIFGVYDTNSLCIHPQNGMAAVVLAEQVLMELDEIVGKYGKVSVLDFYTAAGATATPECQNWGWYEITKAKVNSLPDGNAWIDMPKPISLR